MKIALACAATCLLLSSCIVVNGGNAGVPAEQHASRSPQVRGALSGHKQLLVSFYATAPDCTSLGYPTLKVARPPKHGQVSIEQGTALAFFPRGDARSACDGRAVPATVVYYTSEPGFIGTDSVGFDRIGVAGAYGYHAYTINVR